MTTTADGAASGENLISHVAIILMRSLKEARPCVLGVFMLRFACGAEIVARNSGELSVSHALTGAVTCLAATLSVYLFNGIMDLPEDRANGSRRPIAASELSQSDAAWVAAGAAAVALAGASRLGAAAVAAVAAILLIGWQYSGPPLYLKRRPLAVTVGGALLGLLTYVTGFLDQARPGQPHGWPALAVVAISMSAWMGLVGVPAKDLPDRVGDAAGGRATLAVTRGDTVTRWVIVAAASTVAAAFAVLAAVSDPALRWPAAVLLAGAAAVSAVTLSPVSRGDRSRLRRPYRAFMVTQYAVNAALILAVLSPGGEAVRFSW